MSQRLYSKIKVLLPVGWYTIFERILKFKTEIKVNREKEKSLNNQINFL
jgi:hypothetical protein